MEALTLIIDKPNTVVAMRHKALWITRKNHEPLSVPLGCLGSVIVLGKPLVACDVWRALAEANIPACLLPGRGNKTPAFLGAGLSSGLERRQQQHAVFSNETTRLAVAISVVRSKFEGYQNALDSLAYLNKAPIDIEEPSRQDFLHRVESAIQQLNSTESINSLLGIEGAVSRAWFSLLIANLDSQWEFTGRNRRPPKDPFNSLLSLTYTMIAAKAQHAVHNYGLDPQLGFLHSPRPGRPALSLDLLEAFRPSADIFALAVLATLQIDDFSFEKHSGCTLGKSAKRDYFSTWAHHQENWLYVSNKKPNNPEETTDKHVAPLSTWLNQVTKSLCNDIEQLHAVAIDTTAKFETQTHNEHTT